ncbi:DNA polymerase III subunit delta [Lichenifustis flavocetrariae]|uniref:DNA-directed DNA polymerase n=1 Tax=Lichenifustis flavocetrariae TaxID=2949735 RepID=A0AA41YWP3_9HYPH|nr:DNA polymerase III subunit delta [Lichenifustis flavocetrariae]MCW6509974.1 DNA polymerase III subunit delta [Lichenifustis flavocetrariae]
MVAVKSHEAERFLSRDLPGFSLFLVFGADTGLISERVRAIVKALVDDPADPFQLVRLAGDEIARDPGRLADEAGTIPLFGGRRAVLVDAGTKTIAPAVESLLDGPAASPVVIEAGALKKDAPLRKVVERSRVAAAIECYPDEERDVLRLIDGEMAAAGLRIDPEARQMLVTLLGADRLASRSELAKLALYARGEGHVTVETIEAVVTDASAVASDALVDAAFTGDLAGLDAGLRRSVTNSGEAGTTLSAALRHAVWLHRAKLDLANGGSLEGVLSQLARHGISFKRKGAIERQLRNAGSEALFRAVTRLGEAVGQARRNPDLAQSLAGRALWSVALALRAPRPGGA